MSQSVVELAKELTLALIETGNVAPNDMQETLQKTHAILTALKAQEESDVSTAAPTSRREHVGDEQYPERRALARSLAPPSAVREARASPKSATARPLSTLANQWAAKAGWPARSATQPSRKAASEAVPSGRDDAADAFLRACCNFRDGRRCRA